MGRIIETFTREQLLAIMEYNSETGIAYWNRRKPITHKDTRFNILFAGKPVGSIDKQGYIVTKINNLSYRVHKLVFFMHHGTDPDFIDHINGITSDNRIKNLRSVTASENQRNRKGAYRSKTGFVGVIYDDKYDKWVACITINRKRYHLGTYATMLEAKEARQLAEKENGFTPR